MSLTSGIVARERGVAVRYGGSMRKVADQIWTREELGTRLGASIDRARLVFLIRRLAYPEVRVQSEGEAVSFPGFVPLADLLAEVLADIDRGAVAVQRCRVCTQDFDIDTEEGVFGDYNELTRFICRGCAESLSAWAFCQQHLAT